MAKDANNRADELLIVDEAATWYWMGVDLAGGPSYTVYRVYYGVGYMGKKQDQTKGKWAGSEINPDVRVGVVILENDIANRNYEIALIRQHYIVEKDWSKIEIARRILDGPKVVPYEIIYEARSEGSRRYIMWNGAKAEIIL